MTRKAKRQVAITRPHFGDPASGRQGKSVDHSCQIAAFILGSRGAVNGQQACPLA